MFGNDAILVGEKTKKMIGLKEKAKNVPNLAWIYEHIDVGGTFSALFPTYPIFLNYLKFAVSNLDSHLIIGIFSEIFDYIQEEGSASEEATEYLIDEIGYEFYAEVVEINFESLTKE